MSRMSRVFLCYVLFAVSMCTSSSSALKILGISTVPSPSHHMWFMQLMNGLVRKGHEIWAVGLEPAKFDVEKGMENQTTSIVFEGVLDRFLESGVGPLEWSQMSPTGFGQFVYHEAIESCEVEIETQGAKKLLELVKNTKFDVIVHDLLAGQCFYGLWEIAKEKPGIVAISPFGQAAWFKDIVGGNNWPAIKPYSFSHQSAPFTFWEKTLNFIDFEIENYRRQYWYLPAQQKLAEKFIGRKLSKSLDEMEKLVSVLLINSYSALQPGTFLPPNAIEVGGLQITNPKPLSQDVKAFLDGAEHGVVLISLGTNVKTSILGPERLKAILTVLGKLKERVLWKFDDDHLEDQPKNVMIKKWLPQGDVIAHPKVRVLWSHCGLLSTQEAVWRGIPVIGMPFFMDQKSIVELLVKKGVALRLDFESLTAERISETFKRILTDSSFDRRMKQLSLEYRDRPMSPMDLAIWHIEYASRHPHGPLASPGRHLSRLQLNLLDVYAGLGIAVLAILWIFRLLLKALFKLMFGTQRKTKTARKLKAS